MNGDPGHGGGSEQAASATPGPGRHQVSYTHNMAGRGLHKEIRKAIAEAEQAGLRVVTFSGHTWGQLECPCGQHIRSTP